MNVAFPTTNLSPITILVVVIAINEACSLASSFVLFICTLFIVILLLTELANIVAFPLVVILALIVMSRNVVSAVVVSNKRLAA